MEGARLYAIVIFPAETGHKPRREIFEAAFFNRLPDICHESLKKGQVMKRAEPWAKKLTRCVEMT